MRSTVVYAVVGLILIALPSAALGQAKDVKFKLLNPSSWDEKQRRDFYHLAEGSEIYPLDWLKALEIDVIDERGETVTQPFLRNIERLGFLPDPDSSDGLPVGLTAAAVEGFEFLGKQVGLNCAACHVGSFNYKGNTYRIDGGPNLLDTRRFFAELAEASEDTLKHPVRLVRFLRNLRNNQHEKQPQTLFAKVFGSAEILQEKAILPKVAPIVRYVMEDQTAISHEEAFLKPKGSTKAGSQPGAKQAETARGIILASAPGDLKELARDSSTLEDLIVGARIMRARIAFLKRLKGVGLNKDTDWGPGRVDAFGSARRFLFDENYAPVHGVSYPPLFDLKRTKWFHYDSNTTSFFERNIGQALGVGAVYSTNDHSSTIRLDNLLKLDQLASQIEPPAWPKEVFGELDAAKVAKGETLFTKHCASCHSRAADWQEELSDVKTDPRRALSFAQPLPTGVEFPVAIAIELTAIKAKAIKDLDPKLQKTITDADKPGDWRATRNYSGRPLIGVWATAPYLHNGSVPTLHDLLTKAVDRPRTFFVGNREFDPVKVGYVSTPPAGRPANFDVRREGNGNYGHEYGVNLTAEEKVTLIEFLKTL